MGSNASHSYTGEVETYRTQDTSLQWKCELKWIIPNFNLLIKRDEVYVSPSYLFAGETFNLFLHFKSGNLNVGLVRQSAIPPINLEVSVGFKTLNEINNKKTCADRSVSSNGKEVYKCDNYLLETELSERKSDFLLSNVLMLIYSLELRKITEDASEIEKAECSYCKEKVDIKNISSHEKKCVNMPIKCPECYEVVALKNWYEHECQASRSEDVSCTSAISDVLQENKFQNDFKELFLKRENCDVVIKVQGQEFQVHRLILEARSPVFASTFRNDMKEKASGIVNIEDCDPSSFSDFLCFLYCGDKGVISEENFFSLFTAADKYDVADLRTQCVEFMKNNLSIETLCDTVTLAVRHSETELIKLTTEFFVENAIEIIKTVKWQSFLIENPTVGNELFLKFASKNLNSSK